jgi:dolichyl-phosphate-mannose--protein O-mannosyl transferase
VWQWLLQIRPTSFYYESPQCGVAKCSQEVLALGTPLLWWSGALSLLLVIALWFRRRENSLILLGVGAGLLPWFAFPDRTTFSFYSIVFEPWIILAIVAVIKEINEQLPARISRISRKLTLGAFIGVIGLNFIYHLPIFVAIIVSYDYWRSLMWFDSWI